MAPPPLVVQEFNRSVAQELCAVAQALPFRHDVGIDAEHVFWADIAGRERIGVAWSPASATAGAYWMIALANADQRPVSKARVREVVRVLAGGDARYELAPPFPGAPHMTLARVPAR